MAKKVNGVVHNMYNNATDSGGYAIPPLAANLALGQLVVNTSESDPCVLFKTSAGKIVKIVSEEVITKALTDILGNSAADLDTLRELIAQFEGSANDILPMLVALTDRVTAAETALGNKANSSVVNAHIGNRENPHGVTCQQIGALGKTETAVSSKGLDRQGASLIPTIIGTQIVYNAEVSKATTGLFPASNNGNSILSFGMHGSDYYQQLGFSSNGNMYRRFFYAKPIDDQQPWLTMYDSNNSNNVNTNWTCRDLKVDGVIRRKTSNPFILFNAVDDTDGWTYAMTGDGFYPSRGYPLGTPSQRWSAIYGVSQNMTGIAEFGLSDSDCYSRITNNAHWFVNKSGGTIKGGLSINASTNDPMWSIGSRAYTMYHAGNINKPDVDFTAKNIIANGIISAGTTNGAFIGAARYGLGDGYTGALIYAYGNNPITFATGNGGVKGIMTGAGNWGFGTNNPTDRIHAVGNVRATEKGIFGGNVESNGSGIFAGDILAKKSGAVVFAANDQSGGSATRLNDLQDVKLPTNLAAKMVLAYDPAQTNADGTTGGYTFLPSAGTGTGKIVADEIESLPDLNLIGSTYVAASDKRLKDNIRPLVGATNILLNFAAKEYEWNEEGRKLGLTDPRAYGLIAQEAAELKDIVDIVRPMGTSDYLGVDYVKIVPILIAGFQEQNKEIGTVNRKIEAIRLRANKAYGLEDANAKKIETLESEVRELKRLMSN